MMERRPRTCCIQKMRPIALLLRKSLIGPLNRLLVRLPLRRRTTVQHHPIQHLMQDCLAHQTRDPTIISHTHRPPDNEVAGDAASNAGLSSSSNSGSNDNQSHTLTTSSTTDNKVAGDTVTPVATHEATASQGDCCAD